MQINKYPRITTIADGDLFLVETASDSAYKSIIGSDLKACFAAGSGSSGNTSISKIFSSAGDANGVFYYLGTALGITAWSNPAGNSRNLLTTTASSTESGNVNTLSGRVPSEWFTSASANSYVQFYLGGHSLICNHYTLQTRANDADYYPRNWYFQGSNDGVAWITLDTQTNNLSLNTISQWADFPITSSVGYRYFRILQFDNDSSGAPYLCLGQVELYGAFT